jgi:RND superfamily putative drug exporter
VLAGTFIVLTFAAGSGGGGDQIRDIGLGLALGILMDTFLVRTLLVPSTVVLLGRWNWWPSKMSRVSAELPVTAVPAQVKDTPGDRAGDEGPAEPREPDRQR